MTPFKSHTDVLLLILAALTATSISAAETPSKSDPGQRSASVPHQEGESSTRYRLELGDYWQLNFPGDRFDASALLWTRDGELLTVNDRGPELYRIVFGARSHVAEIVLKPNRFAPTQLRKFAGSKRGRYDTEGLAQDEQGRIYVSEESDRWVLRLDPTTQTVERIPIDWSPVAKYFSKDPNASFEGIAVGGGKLYVANERSKCRIIEVDLATQKITGDFVVGPAHNTSGEFNYTDLCFYDQHLWVLLRESHTVLRVDPGTRRVMAQFDFGHIELSADFAYLTSFPLGTMEGLAVTSDDLWLLTDNNGQGRIKFPRDTRPTLMRCPRPDKAPKASGSPAPEGK